MKRVMGVLLCAGLFAGSYATIARVLTMGNNDAFFMDETSVFRNPANASIYPNMLMGSFGEYRDSSVDNSQYTALQRISREPTNPFFGGILSYSLKQSTEDGNQYPMLSFGAVFNRNDKALSYLTADPGLYGDSAVKSFHGDTITYSSYATRQLQIEKPLGKIDALLSFALPNGGMIGVGTYMAFQRITENSEVKRESSIYRVTAGLNWPVAKSMDLEVSGGISFLTLIGGNDIRDTDLAKPLPVPVLRDMDNPQVICKGDKIVDADARLFSALASLNGDVVPHVGVKYMKLAQGKITNMDVKPGIGLNINIDKGFFWAGIEGIYNQSEKYSKNSSAIGGRVGAGIERNVVFDWLSTRVGMQKKLLYVMTGDNSGKWEQNPETDNDDDVAAWGMGINIENRLKFDIVLAEELQNTLTNLFSGNMHHVFTRIDATFSF